MEALMAKSNQNDLFSPESTRDSIRSIVDAIQKERTLSDTNVLLDQDLSRSLKIAELFFGETGLERKYTATEVCQLTANTLSTLDIDQLIELKSELISQFDNLRKKFLSISDHPYTLSVENQESENNIYGVTKWLASLQISMSGSVIHAFKAFDSNLLAHWIETPVSKDSLSFDVFFSVLIDILCYYSYSEFKKALGI